MPIDFTRIESGEEFELLCENLLQAMGFAIEAKVARGPDLGKDIIAAQTVTDRAGFSETHRYLIECKHYARSGKSVQERDIGSPIARMGTHKCDRYVLVTSTVPAEKVRAQLAGIPNAVPNYRATTWSRGDLARLLDEHPGVRERYFPSEAPQAVTPAGALAETVEGLLRVMGFACQEHQVAAGRVRLACTRKGAFARPVAVVCKEGTVKRGDVEAMIAEVKAQDLGGGVLVTHTRVSPAARQRAAETDGAVRAFTLDAFYRELIDFEPYVRALVADYEDDELCTYYVDLGCRSSDGSVYKPMDDYVDAWLDDPARNHISVLGDYGTGKTSFCRQYAAKLGRRWRILGFGSIMGTLPGSRRAAGTAESCRVLHCPVRDSTGRGGSFINNQRNARAAVRNRNNGVRVGVAAAHFFPGQTPAGNVVRLRPALSKVEGLGDRGFERESAACP